MKRLQTVVEEVDYLKELNKELENQLKIAIFYAKAYIHLEEGHGVNVSPYKRHLKEMIAIIKKSERGYK